MKQNSKQVRITKATIKPPKCSHDTFFKLIFFDPKLAKELVELLLTKKVSQFFNLDDIKFEKDTHKKQFADIILSFSLKGYPQERVDFFMILEHKSFNDKNSHNQVLKYLYLLREFIIKQTGRAKPIIPGLFHHGKQPLKLKKSLQEEDFKGFYNKIPVEIRESMLNFKLKIISTKDPKIRKLIKNKGSKIWGVIKLLDEIWDIKEPSAKKVKSIIKDYFGDILKDKTKKEVEEIIIGIEEYLRDTTGLKSEEWEKAKKELIDEGTIKKGVNMNIRELIKEKGRWEGREEVIVNMLKEKADISFISKVTGLPAEEIKKFKSKNLKNGK